MTKVLSNKIYREKNHTPTYYYQNRKYHIIEKNNSIEHKEVKIMELDNLFQLSEIHARYLVLFDTDSSFYFINDPTGSFRTEKNISQRHTFDRKSSYTPYQVTYMGRDKICITIRMENVEPIRKKIKGGYSTTHYPYGRDVNMVYIVELDKLVEDVDTILESMVEHGN